MHSPAPRTLRLIDCFAELFVYADGLVNGTLSPPPDHQTAGDHLALLIGRAQEGARAMGVDDAGFADALFAVCAWIDEQALCSAWPEKDKWQDNPLQKRHFDTTHGGQAFFTRLEALDDTAEQVREIYVCCLALGFKGRYYRTEDQQALEALRQANAKRILAGDGGLFADFLFPESYTQEPGLKPADKRKAWRRLSVFSVIAILVPLVLFAGLFTVLSGLLDQDMAERFAIKASRVVRRPIVDPTKISALAAKLHGGPAGVAGQHAPKIKEHDYTVREGESLEAIAAANLGDPLRWVVLYRDNRSVLGKWTKSPDFPHNHLPAGLKLVIKTVADARPADHAPRWIANLRSSTKPERVIDATLKLVDAGYPVYLVQTDSNGQRRLHVRLGFFDTQQQAKAEGEKIRQQFALPPVRVALAQPGEMWAYEHK